MTTVSVSSARANFSKLIESAAVTHERREVTRTANGSRCRGCSVLTITTR